MDKNKNIFVEILEYVKERDMWWLLPVIILIVIVGVFLVFTQSSVLSAFIYALW